MCGVGGAHVQRWAYVPRVGSFCRHRACAQTAAVHCYSKWPWKSRLGAIGTPTFTPWALGKSLCLSRGLAQAVPICVVSLLVAHQISFAMVWKEPPSMGHLNTHRAPSQASIVKVPMAPLQPTQTPNQPALSHRLQHPQLLSLAAQTWPSTAAPGGPLCLVPSPDITP